MIWGELNECISPHLTVPIFMFSFVKSVESSDTRAAMPHLFVIPINCAKIFQFIPILHKSFFSLLKLLVPLGCAAAIFGKTNAKFLLFEIKIAKSIYEHNTLKEYENKTCVQNMLWFEMLTDDFFLNFYSGCSARSALVTH